MYHPYIRQKLFEARAREFERIAAEDRVGRPHDTPPPRRRFEWLKLTRRRTTVPRSVRIDAGISGGDE